MSEIESVGNTDGFANEKAYLGSVGFTIVWQVKAK